MSVVIEARNLIKKYDLKEVVSGIHFEVRKGECFGILGPNGAGKSTTLKMMYGTATMTGGELYILGLNVRTHIRKIKSHIGVVPQEDGLDPDFSVMDNLLVFARYYNLPHRKAEQKARELLRFLHLDEYEERSVDTLSGGLKRRLAIARALLAEPEILFLDEPTTGLDPQARFWIWEALVEMKKQGRTLVLTTHYMEEAESICDRILIIDKGTILCEGTPKALIAQHIGHEVVEFRVEQKDLEYFLKKIQGEYEYQVLNNRIRLFIPVGRDGKEAITKINSDSISIRRATLDDVFLKLAGYELRPE